MPTSKVEKLNTHTIHTVVSNTPPVQTVSELSLNGEVDPVFRNSVAYNITADDIARWDAGGSIDLSSYITKDELSAQAYLTGAELANMGYLTQETVVFPDYSGTYIQTETEPAFNASPAAGITDEDISRWNEGVPIEMSSYVTHDFLSSQAYLTAELEPAFHASPAATITYTDISNWSAAAGTLDMSAYTTKAELVAQAYITATTLDSCGYITGEVLSSQGYITGDVLSSQSYITPQVLSEQSYLTVELEPAFNASPAAGITSEDITRWDSGGGDLSLYVQKSELSEQAYITPAQLYSMSYVTQNDIVFPDYSSTYQAVGDYVTKSQLSDQSYVQFSSVTENTRRIEYPGLLSVNSKMNQNTYTGTPIVSSVTINTHDRHNVCSAGIQSTISYNGTSYNVTTNFLANIAPGFNGTSSAQLAADRVDLIPGEMLTIRDNTNYTYQCNITFNPYTGTLQFFEPNGISLNYKGAHSFIASYDYVLEQMNDFVVSQAYITATKLDSCGYVTGTSLDNMGYVTQNDIVFPDYHTTYQAVGDYLSPSDLVSQSYITSTQLASQSYITTNDLVSQSYVTTNDLVSQSYVTPTQLVEQSYVTATQLVSQSYITPAQLVSQSYVTTNDLVSQSYATKSYVANYVEDAIKEPEVIWETNGVGLTALETNMSANPAWQLTNLDMTPYKHIKIYSRSNQKSGTTASASTTAAMVLEMSLDPRAAGPYGGHYIGSTISQKPNDSNRLATLTCAVSADKTSFAVLRMTSLYGTAATGNSDVNAYVFKIVGYYDEIGGVNTGGDLSDYVSKVELSQQSYITSTTLSNQSYITSTALSGMSYVDKNELSAQSYVTSTALSNCGYVQIRLVTQAQYQDRQDNILYIITDAPPIS